MCKENERTFIKANVNLENVNQRAMTNKPLNTVQTSWIDVHRCGWIFALSYPHLFVLKDLLKDSLTQAI